MSDKPRKIGGKKIGGVKQSQESSGVEEAGKISDVDDVKKAGGVGAVSGLTGNRRRPTRPMTVAERDKLFGMISEEAKKLFKKSKISSHQKAVIENAVKMAVDAGLVEEGDEEESADPEKSKGKGESK